MKASYDSIAPFYDLLSKIVYGDAIIQSQRFLMDAILPESKILIVGGGTGFILEEITKKYSEGLHITYVDISKKMISLAKKKNTGRNEVVFINKSVKDLSLEEKFSVVITPFFLDNFNKTSAKMVFEKLHEFLQRDGLWLFADFEMNDKSELWKKVLLKLMYLFFRTCCSIEANRLPDTKTLFAKYDYNLVHQQLFFRDFICSKVFRKQ